MTQMTAHLHSEWRCQEFYVHLRIVLRTQSDLILHKPGCGGTVSVTHCCCVDGFKLANWVGKQNS